MADEYLGENLIFIISQPRSGSTLLQRMLSGNKDIKASAETWLMLHPLYQNYLFEKADTQKRFSL